MKTRSALVVMLLVLAALLLADPVLAQERTCTTCTIPFTRQLPYWYALMLSWAFGWRG